jgi:putative transposase
MRRLKGGEDQTAMYHCVTRTVNGAFLFEDADKEMLRRQLWQAAQFCGVQVLTYCLLSNHFHLLVRVPAKAKVSDAELLRRYRLLYPRDTALTRKHGGGVLGDDPATTVETTLVAGGSEAGKLRTSLLKRMYDVSEFMKTVKQRFSVWYNRTHDRYGTLWAERFKSVLIENERHALATVAAYIDLNPVRAGLVQDPKDYRFCGYGEAVGEGGRRIREGLQSVLECSNWSTVMREYRMILFGKGTTVKRDGSAAGEIAWENARKVLNDGGRLPVTAVLRCRVRYFSDGAALGSKTFVADVLREYQKLTGRRGRQKEPRPMLGAEWNDMTTLRGLRRAAFG